MKKLLLSLALVALTVLSTGCANISPFSPQNRTRVENQGTIEEMKSNQDSINAELGNLRNYLQARDIESYQAQTGKGNQQNSGIQILSGDGALMIVFALSIIAIMMIVYYKQKAAKQEKTSAILASQIAAFDDANLDDGIFSAAMNTDVEGEIFRLMVSNKRQMGLR